MACERRIDLMKGLTYLEVHKVGLLVEGRGLEAVGVNNVVDLSCAVLEGLLDLVSGRVGT